MASYTELYYHFIWSTRDRLPLITTEIEDDLHRFILSQCRERGAVVFALNGMPDHLHLACTVPPHRSVSGFIGGIKGASAHFINHTFPDTPLYWQQGYGVLTFSKRDLPRIIAYIRNQKTHHAQGDLSPLMERHETETAD